MNKKGEVDLFAVLFIAAIVLTIVGGVYFGWRAIVDRTELYTVTGTVTKTWVDVGTDESFYMVAIKEQGTDKVRFLEVKNNMFHMINEDLVWATLEVGKTYDFVCWGYAIDKFWIFNMYWYSNVIAATEV